MKQFQVYGIGNALVDIDFEVCEDTLKRLNITKGVMTLIDEETHHRLLEELDGIKHLKACGGSAANTVVTIQQLGAKTFYSCKVGNDEAGDFFYKSLVLQGLQTNLHEEIRQGVTGKCIVLVTPDADRTMNSYLGISAEFSKAQLSEKALMQSEYLYIEGYLVASPPSFEAALTAREMASKHHVKTAMTLSDPNMVTFFKKELEALLKDKIDILFANEREALLFTQSDNLEQATERLRNVAATYVITLGEKGAIVFDGKRSAHVPAYPVTVIDTVGAGDVFAGTFLYAITQGYDYFAAADLASYAAGKVVAKFGPRLNDAEIEDVKQTILQNRAIPA